MLEKLQINVNKNHKRKKKRRFIHKNSLHCLQHKMLSLKFTVRRLNNFPPELEDLKEKGNFDGNGDTF